MPPVGASWRLLSVLERLRRRWVIFAQPSPVWFARSSAKHCAVSRLYSIRGVPGGVAGGVAASTPSRVWERLITSSSFRMDPSLYCRSMILWLLGGKVARMAAWQRESQPLHGEITYITETPCAAPQPKLEGHCGSKRTSPSAVPQGASGASSATAQPTASE